MDSGETTLERAQQYASFGPGHAFSDSHVDQIRHRPAKCIAVHAFYHQVRWIRVVRIGVVEDEKAIA